jgi:hypothetical protein
MSRIHFVEGDTDSMYWAVSGCKSEDYQQGFKFVIKDHNFYNDNIYKYAPSGFCTSNFSNPTFSSEFQKIQFDKKLLGLAIEKQCENMLALVPKTYSCSNTEVVKIVESEFEKKINKSILLNSLDLSLLKNKNRTTATNCKRYNRSGKLYFSNYEDVYDHRKTIQEINNNMQMKKDFEAQAYIMPNISVVKNV